MWMVLFCEYSQDVQIDVQIDVIHIDVQIDLFGSPLELNFTRLEVKI